MRNKILLTTFAGVIVLAALFAFTGCASTTPQRPPSVTEQKLYTIVTNYVTEFKTVTNEVVVTNLVAGVPVPTTNYSVLTVTNVTPQYALSPNTNAAQLASTVGAVTNVAAPGFGGLAATVVGWLLGLWGLLRSRQANKTAAVLAQIIEAGQQILLTLPDGQRLMEQYKAYMVKHQAEAGVIGQVSSLVANVVDTESARKVAGEIKRLIDADSIPAPTTQTATAR